ncbi:zf-HC2 domain-containing protein [Hymenobacter persicinus]|uniref:HEAT repeat domain-containing protein n=1 Tax=Hymenobacter persicinus TaxID=2025506 RepID=A0A4Q5LFS0_9BACT|nr:HEAT repeat domain-containing protein [Hymenobacter persicinus]RYU79768.1 HEAT repeat domain-containing protein [Hymenobacter persicinus]
MEANRNCESVQPELLGWLAGDLSAADQRAVEAHLAQCPACQQELTAVRQLWDALGTVPTPEPSEQLRPRFYSMLAEFQAAEVQKHRWSVAGLLERLREWWQPAYALRLAYSVALLVVGLVVGYGLKGRPETVGPDSPPLAAASQPASNPAAVQQVHLLEQLANPSAVQRLKAVSNAEEVAPTNERVLAALLSTLNQDPNVNVRLAALEVLSSLTEEPMVRQGLIKSLTQQDSPLVQSALADLMVQLQDRRSVRPLRKLLQQENLNQQVKSKIEQSIETLSNDQAPHPSTPPTSHETHPDIRSDLAPTVAA